MDWIDLAQNRAQLRTIVKTVTKLKKMAFVFHGSTGNEVGAAAGS
jgi:hypothetical protein